MTINPRQLHYVLTVAEEKSISAAAKKLYISQPSLSLLIRRVEEELGCELFDRTITPLKLTPAGEIYIQTVRQMLVLNQEMKTRLSDLTDDPNGKLAVGLWPNIGYMPLVLKRFFAIYPQYQVDLRNSMGEGERLRLLEQGEIELSIQPIYGTIHNKFVVEQIGADHLVLVIPADFSVNEAFMACGRGGDPRLPSISAEDLALLGNTPLAILDGGKRLHDRTIALFERAGCEPNLKVVNQKVRCCLDLAKDGVCATILPSSLMKYSDSSDRLRCYRIDQREHGDTIAAIYVRDRYLSKAARTLINIMKEL